MKTIRRLFLWAAALFACAVQAATITLPAKGQAIVPGEWNSDFEAGLEYAQTNNVPLVAVVVNTLGSCGNCEYWMEAIETDTFLSWAEKKKPVLVITGTYQEQAASKFTKPTDDEYSNGTPYVAAYWLKRDGEELKLTFSAVRNKMPVKASGSTRSEDIAQEFIASCDLVMGAYPTTGGEFLCPAGAENARLELEEGYAFTTVNVPLERTSSTVVSSNVLVCAEQEYEIDWAEDETNKIVTVTVPTGLAAGETIPLTLLFDGGTNDTSSITVVEPVENSSSNPYWVGEKTADELAYGEWTMDYDVALEKVQGEGGYLLALFGGALWCPNCISFDTNVLEKAEFKAWAEENKVALVVFDQPRLGKAGPQLLTYDNDPNKSGTASVSGAGYLSRKNVDLDLAEEMLALTTELSQKRWLAPESTASRLSNPTVLLLNSEGDVAARYTRYSQTDGVLEENLARLSDLLLLSTTTETNNYASTTTLAMAVGSSDTVTVTNQINSTTKVIRLTDVPAATAVFTASVEDESAPAVTLSLIQETDGTYTNVVATGEGTLTCDMTESSSDDSLFLKVASFSTTQAYGGDTSYGITVSSLIKLLPGQEVASFSASSGTLLVEVAEGEVYCLTGVDTETDAFQAAFEAESSVENGYRALVSGDVSLSATEDEVSYQLWQPGTLSFSVAEQAILTQVGTGTVVVCRTDGVSGRASATVSFNADASTVTNGVHVQFETASLVWEEGDSADKEITYTFVADAEFDPAMVLALTLTADADSAATDVSIAEQVIRVLDTTDPTLRATSFTVSLYANFDASTSFTETIYNNEGTSLKAKKVSGSLPSGLKLVVDASADTLSFSGTPKKTGTFTYVFSLTEKRSGTTVTGLPITLTIEVIDAATVNSNVSVAKKFVTPLFMAEEDSDDVLCGTLTVTQTKANKLTAKYVSIEGGKVSFSGNWQELSDDGTAKTVLTKGTSTLSLALADDGLVTAEFSDSATEDVMGSASTYLPGSLTGTAAFAGTYLVALPAEGVGAGYLTLTVSSSGSVKWKGVMGNGTSVSGSTTISELADGDGFAPVVLYKKNKVMVGIPFKIRANAASAMKEGEYRAVKAPAGTIPFWAPLSGSTPLDMYPVDVWGSCYSTSIDLATVVANAYGTYDLPFVADVSGMSLVGTKYGLASAAAGAEVTVASAKITTLTTESGFKSFKFTPKTGLFKGKTTVTFASGSTVSATFVGVVIPGWHDCGCNEEETDPSTPYYIEDSQPFAWGTLYWTDKVDGVSTKLSVPVRIGDIDP